MAGESYLGGNATWTGGATNSAELDEEGTPITSKPLLHRPEEGFAALTAPEGAEHHCIQLRIHTHCAQ